MPAYEMGLNFLYTSTNYMGFYQGLEEVNGQNITPQHREQ